MLKRFACDMDFYDGKDRAPSLESRCTAHLVYLLFLIFFFFACVFVCHHHGSFCTDLH